MNRLTTGLNEVQNMSDIRTNSINGKTYTPVCPYGCNDCTRDPAFIKVYDPADYGECYEDRDPKTVAKYCGCMDYYNDQEKYPTCPSYTTELFEIHEF